MNDFRCSSCGAPYTTSLAPACAYCGLPRPGAAASRAGALPPPPPRRKPTPVDTERMLDALQRLDSEWERRRAQLLNPRGSCGTGGTCSPTKSVWPMLGVIIALCIFSQTGFSFFCAFLIFSPAVIAALKGMGGGWTTTSSFRREEAEYRRRRERLIMELSPRS